jgi:hypothetical protein
MEVLPPLAFRPPPFLIWAWFFKHAFSVSFFFGPSRVPRVRLSVMSFILVVAFVFATWNGLSPKTLLGFSNFIF